MEDQKPLEVQKFTTMFLIARFIGWTGLHRKMMGHSKWWLLLVLTPCFGIGLIWGAIDFWMILFKKLKMADGRDLE